MPLIAPEAIQVASFLIRTNLTNSNNWQGRLVDYPRLTDRICWEEVYDWCCIFSVELRPHHKFLLNCAYFHEGSFNNFSVMQRGVSLFSNSSRCWKNRNEKLQNAFGETSTIVYRTMGWTSEVRRNCDRRQTLLIGVLKNLKIENIYWKILLWMFSILNTLLFLRRIFYL